MALKTDKNVKLYYSIKEVAEEVGVNESTLRYWEKEFPFLKPKVTSNKVRQYTEKDIEQNTLYLHSAVLYLGRIGHRAFHCLGGSVADGASVLLFVPPLSCLLRHVVFAHQVASGRGSRHGSPGRCLHPGRNPG